MRGLEFSLTADAVITPYDSVLGPTAFLGLCDITDIAVVRQDRLIVENAIMVEMCADRLVADAFAGDAGIFQTLAQLPVKAAISHPVVESIDGNDVAFKRRCIVAIKSRSGGGKPIKKRGDHARCRDFV